MLNAVLLVIAAEYLGDLIADALSLPVPGMIIGLLLVLLLLACRGWWFGPERAVPPALGQVTRGLHDHFGLLFVPAGAGVVANVDRLATEGAALVVVLLVSTLATVTVTALILRGRRGAVVIQGGTAANRHGGMAHEPALLLLMTLGAYAAGVTMQRACRGYSLLNPTLIAIGMVATALVVLRIDYARYLVAARPVHLLLGPGVVAFAVPLYRQIGRVRARLALMIVALPVGSIIAIISGIGMGSCFHLSRVTLLSVAPRTATTAVSMAITTQIGGIPSVTAVLTILSGIAGAVVGPPLLDALHIEDPAARGFSMGLAGNGIATARALQESEAAGAFSGLAMALNAVVTAVLVPLAVRLLIN